MQRRKIKAGRPPKAKVQALGDHVVAVADGLFLAHGYGATSMAMVAAKARIGKQTLYCRYPDKAALFREVVKRRVDGMVAMRDRTATSIDPLNDLKAMGGAAIDAVLNPEFVRLLRIVIAEAEHFPELSSMVVDNFGSNFLDHCVDAIQRAQRVGACKPGDATDIAWYFLSALVGILLNKTLAGVVLLRHDAERRAHLDAVWKMFLGGIAPV